MGPDSGRATPSRRPAPPAKLVVDRTVNCRRTGNVKGACPDAAPVHRAEHLDIAGRIEVEAERDAGFHKFDDAWNRGHRIVCLDKIEVALGFRLAQIGHETLVETVGVHDDLALGRLAEYLDQAHRRNGSLAIMSANTWPGLTDSN
jgi:hypothetical protein